jgi:hypothetical protein
MRAFYRDDHKLICATDGRHELYDLGVDPAESNDLYEAKAALGEEMMRGLLDFGGTLARRAEAAESPELTEEERRRLEALGYLGGGEDDDDTEIAAGEAGECGFGS